MLNPLASLFALLRSADAQGGATPRFWAVVLQADGENALLAVGDKKLAVRLEVPVRVGEKLLLERGVVSGERLQCRIVNRLASEEQQVLAEPVQGVFYPEASPVFPYLLSVEEHSGPRGEIGEQRQWQFTLHTENLGVVALLVRKDGDVYHAQMLLENSSALENLSLLAERFADDQGGIVIAAMRVMTAGERGRYCKRGSTLDITR